jgi:hypothetical protein
MRSTAVRGCARSSTLSVAAAAALMLAVGCASPAKPTMLSTDPQGAKLQVNGRDVGLAPTTYTFDFSDTKSYDVTAAQPGFYDARVQVTPDSADVKTGLLKVSLSPDTAYAATVPSDAANQWALVQADPKLPKDAVWQRLVSVVTDRYTHLTSLDSLSGHLESATYSREFPHPSNKSITIRTQLVAAISSQQPLVYKVKIVSQSSYGTDPDRWTEYPRVFPEDADLVNKIRNQVGVQQAAE